MRNKARNPVVSPDVARYGRERMHGQRDTTTVFCATYSVADQSLPQTDPVVPDFLYRLHENGAVHYQSGVPFTGSQLLDKDVEVLHLKPHVECYDIGRGEVAKVLISYSSHCWTCKASEAKPEWLGLTIWDHARARSYEPIRHRTSLQLPDLMRSLLDNRIYVTPTDRNYGCYNATLRDVDGYSYTAYFTIRKQAGRYDKLRYGFRLFVESAYPKAQPEAGSKTNFAAIIGKARHNKTVKYRRP